jgi:hypothetical protein
MKIQTGKITGLIVFMKNITFNKGYMKKAISFPAVPGGKLLACITALMLSIFCFSNIAQAKSNDNINKTLKHLLNSSGINAEVIQLERSDGFSKGVYVEGPKEIPIIISFKESDEDKDKYLLVSIDGEENTVRIAEDGSYEIMPEQGIDLITTLCLIEAFFNFLIDMDTCIDDNICLAKNIFTFIIQIISCSDLNQQLI